MFRYLVLIWDPGNPSASSSARRLSERLLAPSPEWICALAREGLLGFHAGARPGSSEAIALADGGGVVFGKLFREVQAHEFAATGPVLDASASAAAVASDGRDLLELYWGRYVAVIHNFARREVRIVRDPSGGLPCFLTAHHGVTVVFSDVEDCLRLGVMKFSIDWEYVARYVAYPALQARETGLREISEVLPGECLCLRAGGFARSFAWRPLDIAQRRRIEHPLEAVQALRLTTRACVSAWGASYRGILHNLSGGLDSSIVLSCLCDAPAKPPILCVNYFSTGGEEDERYYARLVTGHCSTELREHQLDASQVKLDRLLNLRRSPKPGSYLYDLDRSPVEARLANAVDANGVFSGAGGDALFYQSRTDLAVTDYLYRRALPTGVLAVALDAARVSRSSIGSLLARAWRARRQGTPLHPLRRLDALNIPRRLIPPQVLDAARHAASLELPWLADAENVPPGLLWQVTSLSVPPAFYDSFTRGNGPERTMPLLSQPLMELCLQIPTYVWISGGRDRSIARQAFAADLPPEIVKRRAKGRADHYSKSILDDNRDFVRELLLDGLLVREGLLKRDALEAQLSRAPPAPDYDFNEILQQHLCTEIWARGW